MVADWLADFHSMHAEKTALTFTVFVLGVIFFAVLMLIATVAVYNRPKFAVAPRYREDSGLAATGKRFRPMR